MTPLEQKVEDDRFRRQKVRKNRLIAFFIVLVSAVVIFTTFMMKWISSAKLPNFNTESVPMDSYMTIALVGIAIFFIWDFYRKKKKQSVAPQLLMPVKVDKIDPKMGDAIRLMICVVFHFILCWIVYTFLNTYVYQPLGGNGFIVETIKIATYLALISSIWYSFDMSSIELNFAGELLYFGKPRFSNIPNGLFCLGLPSWVGTELRVVDFRQKQITIGMIKNGEREPFIVECRGFRAIFDCAFSVKAQDTRIILNLIDDASNKNKDEVVEDIERQMVTRMNEVIYRLVNESINGVDTYPDIASLKSSTAKISHRITNEESNETNKGETARELLAQLGYKLVSVEVKDVENENTDIISAQQALEARKLLEEAEMLDLENTATKVNWLYDKLNRIGQPDEIPEKERVSLKECRDIVERKEGSRKTYEGLGRSFTSIPS